MIYSVCFLSVLVSWKGTTECMKTSTCTYKMDNGETIDLSALSTNNGTPRFQNVADTQNIDVYSLSVCNDFSQGTCYNVTICRIYQKFRKNQYLDIGDLNTAVFMEDKSGQITIHYTAGNRRSLVSLTCNHSIEAQLIALGEQPPQSSIYHFELRSKYACPVTSPVSSSSNEVAIIAGVCGGIGVALIVVIALVAFRKRIFSKCGKSDTYKELR